MSWTSVQARPANSPEIRDIWAVDTHLKEIGNTNDGFK